MLRLFTPVAAVAALLAAVLCLHACGETKKRPAPVAAAPSPAVALSSPADGGTAGATAEAPTAEAPYEYVYSPVGKRDPFRSVLIELADLGRPQGPSACQTPLCKWDLDQFRLVAVVTGMSSPLAMVEDPKGKGHFVRRGTQIGKNNGKVTQIRPSEVVVTEIVRTTGKPLPNPIVLKLPADRAPEEVEDLSSGGQ